MPKPAGQKALMPQCTAMWGAKRILPVAYKKHVLTNVTALLRYVSVAYKAARGGRRGLRLGHNGRGVGPAPDGAARIVSDGGEHGADAMLRVEHLARRQLRARQRVSVIVDAFGQVAER